MLIKHLKFAHDSYWMSDQKKVHFREYVLKLYVRLMPDEVERMCSMLFMFADKSYTIHYFCRTRHVTPA
mgnify:CR=1 FL=1